MMGLAMQGSASTQCQHRFTQMAAGRTPQGYRHCETPLATLGGFAMPNAQREIGRSAGFLSATGDLLANARKSPYAQGNEYDNRQG